VKRLLFGGSFDPIHAGHVAIAHAAAKALGADRVSFVPAADAPHKRGAAGAPAADRLEMCRLATSGDPLFDVLDVEIRRGGVSYTIDTVRELLAGPCRGDQVILLLGQDSLADLPGWRDAAALVALVPIATVPRRDAKEPPWAEIETAFGRAAADGMRARFLRVPPVEISSTQIRRRIAEGKSIRCWVPDAVADFVERRGLYRAAPSA
jgi:nicotinate-nucleotide adenylyltransferase